MQESGIPLKTQIDSLTGIRFFAAMLVYLSHHPKPDYMPGWLVTFFVAGYNGVTFFFVLSGCVIGLNYFDALAKPTASSLIRYATARLARIYPLYLLVLLYVWLSQGVPATADLVYHIFAVQTWSPDFKFAYAFNGPGWSIGIEFFLYACFPLIVLLLNPLKERKKLLWLTAIGVTLVMLGIATWFVLSGQAALTLDNPASAHRWLYRTPVTRLGDFVLGVIAALLYKSYRSHGGGFLKQTASPHLERIWSGMTYVALVAIIALMVSPANLNSAYSWDASYAPLAFLLMLGIALSPRSLLGRLLSTRSLVIFGEASFALYLIHIPLIDAFDIYGYLDLAPWNAIILWAAFLSICIALLVSLHRYIETPLRRIINAQVDRLMQTAACKMRHA